MQVDSIEADILGHHETLTPQAAPSTPAPFTLTLHPAFNCFFQKWTQSRNIPYHECYERVMRSHFQLEKIRTPTQQLLEQGDISLVERSQQLYLRTMPWERMYIQSRGDPMFVYSFGKEKEKEVEQFQKQLQLYQKRGEEALSERRKHFKRMREEQEAVQLRQQEEIKRRERVLQEVYADIEQKNKKHD